MSQSVTDLNCDFIILAFFFFFNLKQTLTCTEAMPPFVQEKREENKVSLEDVAQLVMRRNGTQLTQVRFSGAARDFSPSHLSVHTVVCNRTVKIPWSMSEFDGLW